MANMLNRFTNLIRGIQPKDEKSVHVEAEKPKISVPMFGDFFMDIDTGFRDPNPCTCGSTCGCDCICVHRRKRIPGYMYASDNSSDKPEQKTSKQEKSSDDKLEQKDNK